jgi:hypothetical protein
MKRVIFYFIFFTILPFLNACNLPGSATDNDTDSDTTEVYAGLVDDSTDYDWDVNSVTHITLNKSSITVDSASKVSVSGSVATIISAGTYYISGTLTNGQILVDVDGSDALVRLVLNGVNITCSNSSPIYVQDAKKVLVYLPENTTNYLTDGSSYVLDDVEEGEPNATLFCKSDLVIFGNGSLVVDGNYLDGITSKDGLLIKGGNITVTAADDGIKGRDCLVVQGGTFNLTTVGDGMISTNDEDETCGYVLMDSCTVTIVSGGDAIAAKTSVTINGGTYKLTSGGGSGYTASSVSCKGIKGVGSVTINDGTLTVSSADDAIHSNDTVNLNGGTLTLSTGDDGVHADGTVNMNACNLTISKSYEGIEGKYINFSEGTWSVTSSNDCINASAGTTSGGTESNDGSTLIVNSGTLLVNISGTGDGLDSNGTLSIKGGTVVVQGPSSSPEVALDVNGSMTITGGYLIACGPNAGSMIEPTSSTYSSASTQYCIITSLSSTVSSSTYFHIQDASGNNLVTFKPLRTAYYFVFSSPDLTSGSTYSIYTGGSYTGTTNTNGLYTGGTYSGGTLQKSLTASSSKLISSLTTSTGGGR